MNANNLRYRNEFMMNLYRGYTNGKSIKHYRFDRDR